MPDYTTGGVPIYQMPPEMRVASVSLHLRYNTSTFSSPWTRQTQTTALPGALYDLSADFVPLRDGARLAAVRAFIARLRGASGRFYLPAYPCRYQPAAMGQPERETMTPLTADNTDITADSTLITIDSTVVVMETQFGVSSTPNSTTIVGTLWLNSRRYPLHAGGYISWDDADGWRHLHTVVEIEYDVGTGDCTLTVEPPMTSLPTPSTPIHVHAPSCVARLADDGQGVIQQAGGMGTYNISAVQALPLVLTT